MFNISSMPRVSMLPRAWAAFGICCILDALDVWAADEEVRAVELKDLVAKMPIVEGVAGKESTTKAGSKSLRNGGSILVQDSVTKEKSN
jgi:hypothetical protein